MSKFSNQEPAEEWVAVPADGLRGSKETILSRSHYKRWSLVLEALQIPYHREQGWRGVRLIVKAGDFDTALRELRQFEQENHNWPPPPPTENQVAGSLLVTLSVIFLLASFHNLTQFDGALPLLGKLDWYSIGSLHAGKLREGEFWRAITALTLHADMRHLMGNSAVLTLFIEQLRKRYGSGAAWLLFILCGAGGNAVNAALQSWQHQAVGASTAVFGLLGVIGADSVIRYRHQLLKRWAMPFAAAVALLGFLGTSGDNTDLGAHLWGFVCGALLGALFSVWRQAGDSPSPRVNRLYALAALMLVITAWACATLLGPT